MTTSTDSGRPHDAGAHHASHDSVTDLVIRQFPDEALMRRRAYSQTVSRAKVWRRGMPGHEREA